MTDDTHDTGQVPQPSDRVVEAKDDASLDAMAGDRIAKVIAAAGLCSRREAERWIADGRVVVNGNTLATPAFTVTASDDVRVDGNPLPEQAPIRLWRYHKPRGRVTTHSDPRGRPTVFEAMPEEMPRVISIGRLDLNTEGLLLITTSGSLARHLELPSTAWLRRYRARARGTVSDTLIRDLAKGVTIEGVSYGPIEARLDRTQGANTWLTLGLREGKNREVRRVLQHFGLEVNRLIRTSYGPFQLGDLAVGAIEEVKPRILVDQLGPDISADLGLEAPSRESRRADMAKSAARSGTKRPPRSGEARRHQGGPDRRDERREGERRGGQGHSAGHQPRTSQARTSQVRSNPDRTGIRGAGGASDQRSKPDRRTEHSDRGGKPAFRQRDGGDGRNGEERSNTSRRPSDSNRAGDRRRTSEGDKSAGRDGTGTREAGRRTPSGETPRGRAVSRDRDASSQSKDGAPYRRDSGPDARGSRSDPGSRGRGERDQNSDGARAGRSSRSAPSGRRHSERNDDDRVGRSGPRDGTRPQRPPRDGNGAASERKRGGPSEVQRRNGAQPAEQRSRKPSGSSGAPHRTSSGPRGKPSGPKQSGPKPSGLKSRGPKQTGSKPGGAKPGKGR